MKCPVCKNELADNVAKCAFCGFDDLCHEFINAGDAADWFESVVAPHRIEWEQANSQHAILSVDELYTQMVAHQKKEYQVI